MRQKVNRIYGLIILFGLVFGGCATFQKVPSYSYYSQDQEVMVGIFRLKIEEVYWRDVLDMSEAFGEGYPIPQQANVQMPKITPDAKFLVVVISVTNTDKKPYAMGHGIMLTLRSINGVEYSTSQKVAGIGTGYLAAGGTNIAPSYNPNMPTKYKIIFDIPRDNYALIVSKTRFQYGGSYRDGELFEWRLSPISD